ncbi:epidermal growth factor receptor kinase substrate 8-like isoform X1 [Daphnia pulex]|uniref:epidermal growth factor receptor kinase substrate 8-like isoform X1 n=1 Tax=Daphnia pulex TaxID=6669 RepID=UPI001EDF4241|nr:epidermal growth factor receptor kinase substrate 8-like isoform X1 [Daphnia pulex]XP_046459352.1 epidermal growth factor receptor kinase substrate 8-like isoform X1 [Daphnia pulex]XP_046459360.1 epidermal growth factor receptor kinase substrate 8-like isoform X1 [Daphnia pulex]XP_046459368.1 epidermal growth factor receptor kinase substrate 8-like isoform X1 [Daphnia pulex]
MAYRENRLPGTTNGYTPGGGSGGSQTDIEDGPSFVVEHLATFTVSQQNEVMYPADGMRRLLHMEKTSGIWTQKMILRLDREWVTIQDFENGEVVERFPLNLILEPTAFTSLDPKDLYNNIFIFVVGEDPLNRDPPEMHIFQCVGVSSELVTEDMKMYMAGNYRPSNPSRIPPPPNKPPPEPPLNGQANHAVFMRHINDDASSTSSERYEKDVTVLNRCFDDIERFIARLQHAAAARRELERRRKSRKSKKKEQGDGMLSMRARPPSEAEYIDIFQKFKLSFNLLAKLKSHIHDPNAPELVHFLFSPLTLIVEASHESNTVPNLPARVVAPLLTYDAIELLSNCLSSKETELWHSLGDAWHTPKDKWNSYVVPYVPTFMDGWTPDASFFPDEKEENKRSNTEMTRYSNEFFYDSDRGDRRSHSPPSDRDFGPRSDISNDSIEKNGDPAARFEHQQRRWLAELKARNAKIVQVTYPRTANNDKELTVVRGEYLEVLDNSRKWWKARNMHGVTAHVPHTIVTMLVQDDDVFTPPSSAGWHKGKKGADTSDSYSEDSDGLPAKSRRQRRRAESVISIPPPPPPLPPKEVEIIKKPIKKEEAIKPKPMTRSLSSQDMMVEELKNLLDIYQPEKNKLDIRKTPEMYITLKSTPDEVRDWLKAKEFDIVIQKRLNGMSGEELFKLKKADLEKYCGKEEGHRLDSQLTLQRRASGYQTMRSSELQEALKRARMKTETKNDQPKNPTKKEEERSRSSETGGSHNKNDRDSSPTVQKAPKKQTKAKAPLNLDSDYDSDDDIVIPTGTLRDIIRKQKKKMQSTSSNDD